MTMTLKTIAAAAAIVAAGLPGGASAQAAQADARLGFAARAVSDYPPAAPAVPEQRARMGCTQLEREAGMTDAACGTVPLHAVAATFFDRTSEDDED
jgi:hypothetical protein